VTMCNALKRRCGRLTICVVATAASHLSALFPRFPGSAIDLVNVR
jgi:hypothetical protein